MEGMEVVEGSVGIGCPTAVAIIHPLPPHKELLSDLDENRGNREEVLPHDARARRLFVTTGGLRKVQQLVAEQGTPLHDYISIINLCFPQEIVSYYSPNYPASLLERLELFEPKIPPEILLADRRPSEDYAAGEIPCPHYQEEPQGSEYGETAPPALPYDFKQSDTDIPTVKITDDDEEGKFEERSSVATQILSDAMPGSQGVIDQPMVGDGIGHRLSRSGSGSGPRLSRTEGFENKEKSSEKVKGTDERPLVEIGRRSPASDMLSVPDS